MLKKPGALFIWNSPPGLFFYALNYLLTTVCALERAGYFISEKRTELYREVLLRSLAAEKCAARQEAEQSYGFAGTMLGWCEGRVKGGVNVKQL